MVHSRMRTEECYNLKCENVEYVKHNLIRLKHCLLDASGKTGNRRVHTTYGCYFNFRVFNSGR